MKKALSVALAACVVAGGVALTACNKTDGNGDRTFEYHVVDSKTIVGMVTGENPAADYCILPLNAASKVLGAGSAYQMLGTVTHGNLYFISTASEPLTVQNLSSLKGKTIGVVQLKNVPGLTLQVVLNKHEIGYQIIDSVQAPKDTDKVNLVAMDAENITPASGCDYYLCPEPAATAKINGTADKPVSFRSAGDLQELYGGENGYPQAVLVAKKGLAGDSVTGQLVSYLQANAQYLLTAQTADILSLLASVRTEGLAPAFNANNLSSDVVAHCSVRYVPSDDCKEEVNAFLGELIGVDPSSAKSVSEEFYYTGGFTAESTVKGTRTLYVPDGAPALAVLSALRENAEK